MTNIYRHAVVVDFENEAIFYGPTPEVRPIHQHERGTAIYHFISVAEMTKCLDEVIFKRHPDFSRIDVEIEERENEFLSTLLHRDRQTILISQVLMDLRGNNTQWLIKVPQNLSMNNLFLAGRGFLSEILMLLRSDELEITKDFDPAILLREKYIAYFGYRSTEHIKESGG